MEHINPTVNSISKILNTVNSFKENNNTVNSLEDSNNTENGATIEEKIERLIEKENITPEGVAQILAEGLSDLTSLIYYTLLAKTHPAGKLLKALHLTKETFKDGRIRLKKAVYFQGILKKWGLQTKFKEGE